MIALLQLATMAGCSWFGEFDYERGARIAHGDPLAGRQKMRKHSCTSCHIIPGIPDADGKAGPALEHWSSRKSFAGHHANTPDNMVRWLRRPSDLRPHTSMPAMGVSEQDGRDMAAYLFSIR